MTRQERRASALHEFWASYGWTIVSFLALFVVTWFIYFAAPGVL